MDPIPHIALPIQIVNGAYVTNQQDTDAEAAACVAAILSFEIGSREEAPDFGITDPSFSAVPIDTDDIEAACEAYEPRATLTITQAPYDPRRPLETSVQIAVTVETSED